MANKPRKFNLNAKTVTAPLAAFTMACILFVYARTSIHAAKQNAQRHREADGGQISWRNESLRRHGSLDAPVPQDTVSQLAGSVVTGAAEGKKREVDGGVVGGGGGSGVTVEEERIREVAARRGRRE